MPSYRPIWVKIAQQQYDTLSEDVRLFVDHRLTQLLGDPTADAVYNRRSDQWSILLEGRQRPEQTRDLYLVAGITCGLMAMTSQDLGAPP